ncbi:AT-rich interactive domain-containing protein 4B [Halotydeus destructor]|nr:AT-rich interactive domain-containing protein 4B [Halotydeus destructor]
MQSSPAHPGQVSDFEPPFLAIGTEVSAKYKGAFCEARIKSIKQLVKCRVAFSKTGPGVVVNHDCIKGTLRVGATVEAKLPDNKNGDYKEATITKIMDVSQYTVIFDDGDETTLRRTSLCLKSGRHYSESESLDHLPLTNPEHFGNPVSISGGRNRRSRRRAGQYGAVSTYTSNMSDVEDNESAEGDAIGSIDDEEDSASNITQPSSEQKDKDDDNDIPSPLPERGSEVGTIVCVDMPEKRSGKTRDFWYPALIVSLSCSEKPVNKELEYVVRSFSDNRFYTVLKKDAKNFERSKGVASMTDVNISVATKRAVEKAIFFHDKGELPATWDREQVFGHTGSPVETDAAMDAGMVSSELDSAADEEPEGMDELNHEERDRFVAQLYKYMDERDTPINKEPQVGGKDLDLYRLYITVNKLGGYNKITNKNNWKLVCNKMSIASSTSQNADDLKSAYKKYLLNFNDFYRKLGGFSAFVHSAQPSRGSASRPSRNERTWRERHDSGKEVTPAKTRRKKSVTDTEPIKREIEEAPNSVESIEKEDKPLEEDEKNMSLPRRNSAKRKIKGGRKKTIVKTEVVESDDGAPELPQLVDGDSDSDYGEFTKDPPIGKDVEVTIGAKVKIRWSGNNKQLYDAKVLKAEKNPDITKQRFLVHYNGWNTRYDEWIKRKRIMQVVTDKTPKGKRQAGLVKPPPKAKVDQVSPDEPSGSEAKLEGATPVRRGRPPSAGSMVKMQTVRTKSKMKRTRHKSFEGGDHSLEDAPLVDAMNDESTESTIGQMSREDSISSLSNQADAKVIKSEAVDSAVTEEETDTVDDAVTETAPKEEASPKIEPAVGPILSHRLSQDLNDAPPIGSPERTEPETVPDELKPLEKSPIEEDEERHKSSKRKRKDLDGKESNKKDKEDRKKHKSPAKEGSEEDSPRKKKSRKHKHEDKESRSRDHEEKHKHKVKKDKPDSENVIIATTQPELNKEEEYVKIKRKRSLGAARAKEATPPEALSPSSDTKKEELPIKKRKRQDDKSKNDAADTNDEDGGTETRDDDVEEEKNPEAPVIEVEGASAFLLCAEEVPMSPVPQPADEKREEKLVTVHANSTFASAVLTTPEPFTVKPPVFAAREIVTEAIQATPPRTPESQTLSNLTPPHETHNADTQSIIKSAPCSASASDIELTDTKVTDMKQRYSPPQMSEDSCSQGPVEQCPQSKRDSVMQSPVTSPKKRARGRKRTASMSETVPKETAPKSERTPIKTRGASSRRSRRLDMDNDNYSPSVGISALDILANHSASTPTINLDTYKPNLLLLACQPMSKYNFCEPVDENLDAEKRILILQDRMNDLRATYMNIKSEMASLERRRKKTKRKNRSSANSPNNGRTQLDRSISSDFSDDQKVKSANDQLTS